MTLGEIAQMANGQGWLKGGIKADLEVIKCSGYTRTTKYSLPIAPVLTFLQTKALLCTLHFAFEPTAISIGRALHSI